MGSSAPTVIEPESAPLWLTETVPVSGPVWNDALTGPATGQFAPLRITTVPAVPLDVLRVSVGAPAEAVTVNGIVTNAEP